MYLSYNSHWCFCLYSATGRVTPPAPSAPRFTIETEDEESGNNMDPRDAEKGIELTTTKDTFNPMSGGEKVDVQESMCV